MAHEIVSSLAVQRVVGVPLRRHGGEPGSRSDLSTPEHDVLRIKKRPQGWEPVLRALITDVRPQSKLLTACPGDLRRAVLDEVEAMHKAGKVRTEFITKP